MYLEWLEAVTWLLRYKCPEPEQAECRGRGLRATQPVVCEAEVYTEAVHMYSVYSEASSLTNIDSVWFSCLGVGHCRHSPEEPNPSFKVVTCACDNDFL